MSAVAQAQDKHSRPRRPLRALLYVDTDHLPDSDNAIAKPFNERCQPRSVFPGTSLRMNRELAENGVELQNQASTI